MRVAKVDMKMLLRDSRSTILPGTRAPGLNEAAAFAALSFKRPHAFGGRAWSTSTCRAA
jgi:hypothetical protein